MEVSKGNVRLGKGALNGWLCGWIGLRFDQGCLVPCQAPGLPKSTITAVAACAPQPAPPGCM